LYYFSFKESSVTGFHGSCLLTERSFNVACNLASDNTGGVDGALATLALLCQQVGSESALAGDLTGAGKLDSLGGSFVGL
jgi:hypothetical protein